MIRKIQTYFNILIILFVVIGIIYFVGNLIIGLFKDDKVIITAENYKEYLKEETLVTSHNTFGAIEQCVTNLYETMLNEDYNAIYSIISSNTKKHHEKEEIINTLKMYNKDIFGIEHIMDGISFSVSKAYNTDNGYLVKIDTTYVDTPLFIMINLDMYTLTYTIDLVI